MGTLGGVAGIHRSGGRIAGDEMSGKKKTVKMQKHEGYLRQTCSLFFLLEMNFVYGLRLDLIVQKLRKDF